MRCGMWDVGCGVESWAKSVAAHLGVFSRRAVYICDCNPDGNRLGRESTRAFACSWQSRSPDQFQLTYLT